MREMIKKFNLYTFNELPEPVQKTVFEKYKNSEVFAEIRNEIFFDDTTGELGNDFPESKIKLQYDFSCTQGSGFNIYGDFSIIDLLQIYKAGKYFDLPVYDYIYKYRDCIDYIKAPYNSHYTYELWSISGTDTINDYIVNAIECYENTELTEKETVKIKLFSAAVAGYISELCGKYYNSGYDYITGADYTIDDYREESELNNFEYLENGDLYN